METYTRDGLTFDVRDSGPEGGDVVVCLHGFPEDASSYDDVAARLAAAGRRVLVPDQRGYSPGARPSGRRPYVLRELVGDVLALLDAAGVDRAHVVGHDWGGAVAWALASWHPDRVAGLTVLTTAHPAAMVRAMPRGQLLRSWYIAAFQLPRLPERLLLADDGARLRGALVGSGLERDRADHYVSRMREPGAFSGALGWYRALPLGARDAVGRIRVPTTYLHGARDPFFTSAAVAGTGRFVAAPFRSVRLDATHWIPEQAPDAVVEAVLDPPA